MFETFNLSILHQAITATWGWLDLLLALMSFVIAYSLTRLYFRAKKIKYNDQKVSLLQGVLRVAFPTLTILLILCARYVFHKCGLGEAFFLNAALPLAIALLVIRFATYPLHMWFPQSSWLRASDRALSFTIWFIVILYFLGILPELISELDEIKLPIGASGLSVWALLKSIVVVGLVVSITLWVSSFFERFLLPQEAQGRNASAYSGRLFLVRLLRTLLLLVAVLLAMQGIGIDLTVFAVLGGAIGVGIGFGLQKITANYISGFVVLIERSVKIGDMVTVGQHYGVVREIGARYIVLRDLVGVDALIPNETLLTSVVYNHSSSQREARGTVTISVAYGTDIRLAQRLMIQAASEQPRLISEGPKAPTALLSEFADSGINLTLAYWVRDPENGQGGLKSALNMRIWDLFVENKISVPFPQREVRILS